MATTARTLSPDSPELDGTAWRRFAGGTIARAILLGHATALDNEFVIASSWDAARTLRGVAVALVETHERDRRVLAVRIPSSHVETAASGVLVADGEDVAEVAQDLLGALGDHARASGIPRLLLANCAAGAHPLARAAEQLGGRMFPAAPDHRLLLPAGAGVASYHAGLGSKRAWKLRADLRRAEAAGAEVVHRQAPTASELDAAWPLVEETLRRNASHLVLRGNLLAALAAAAPAAAVATFCRTRDGAPLGVLFGLRDGATTQFNYLGHVVAPPLHVSSTLWAHAIEAELARGAERLLLGMTGDTLKHRLGATPVEQVHWVIPLSR